MDALIGRVEGALDSAGAAKTHLVILSDHGFADFKYKVHLNRWLIDNGYLKPIGESAAQDPAGKLSDVDW